MWTFSYYFVIYPVCTCRLSDGQPLIFNIATSLFFLHFVGRIAVMFRTESTHVKCMRKVQSRQTDSVVGMFLVPP